MQFVALLAQAGDGLSGTSGWVGTGLLGAVLSWLLFIHLPAKDKLFTTLVDAHTSRMERLAKEFQESLAIVVEHCRQETEMLRKSSREDRDELFKRLDGVCKQGKLVT